MNMFSLILTILLTKKVFCENDTFCAAMHISSLRTSSIPENCTFIEGDLTLSDIHGNSSLPLDNLKSVRVINGTLEIAHCSIRSLNFLSGIVNVTGSISLHDNTELLYVEHLFKSLSSDPYQFDFGQLQMKNNPEICLFYNTDQNLKKKLQDINDVETREEIHNTSCQNHCAPTILQIEEDCKYVHGDLILENVDESQRSELKKYMNVEVIIEGSLIIRNNTAIKKLGFLSKLREINPHSNVEPNETVAIQITDNGDIKADLNEISIISVWDLSNETVITLDDDAMVRLIAENYTPPNTTLPSSMITTTENYTMELETTPAQEEATTQLTSRIVVQSYHLILAWIAVALLAVLLLSAALLGYYVLRIILEIKKQIKSREQFYSQTPTFSHRLEIDSDTPMLSSMSPSATPK